MTSKMSRSIFYFSNSLDKALNYRPHDISLETLVYLKQFTKIFFKKITGDFFLSLYNTENVYFEWKSSIRTGTNNYDGTITFLHTQFVGLT